MKTQPTPRTRRSHYHVTNTPFAAKYRHQAREIRRQLERDVIRGKLPEAARALTFAVVECHNDCLQTKLPKEPKQ